MMSDSEAPNLLTLAMQPPATPAPANPPSRTEIIGAPTGVPVSGGTPGTEGKQLTPSGTPAGAPAQSPGGSMLMLFLPLVVVMVLMIVFSSFSQKKEQKKRAALMSSLGTNDRVQTIGGIIGTIAELRDDEVVLRVDEASNTRVRFARSAIQQVLRKAGAGGAAASQAEAKLTGVKAAV